MGDIKNKERISVTGKIKVDVFRAGYADAITPLLEEYAKLRNIFYDKHLFPYWCFRKRTATIFHKRMEELNSQIEVLRSDCFIRTAVECPNTVMDSPNYGIDLLIQWLSGTGTYASTIMPLSFIEIGTGNTSPTITDTALTTPTNRAAVGFQQDYGTTDAIVQAIFSDSQLTNGTYYEMGSFCGGTSTIGSGQIFNHALFATPYTKSSGTDSSISVDINFS